MLLVEVVGVVGASRMQQGFALLCYAVMLCMHNSALRFVRLAYVITIDRLRPIRGDFDDALDSALRLRDLENWYIGCRALPRPSHSDSSCP